MYAHLYFPGNTSTGAQIRDITRLITSCTTTTASLSGLEFIDTNVSTVVGGNSGWSLHSSSTLPSAGATVGTSTDSNFIMQASCITSSKTKYAGVSCNGNWTNSSVVTGDDYAFNLASVLDPGTATEMWGNGYTGTSSGNGDVYGICGNTEHSDNGIHIFADSTRIFMHGKDGNNQVVWMMNAEFTETNTTQAETLVPAVQIFCNDLHSGMNISEHVTYRGDGAAIWDDQTTSYSFIQFSESNNADITQSGGVFVFNTYSRNSNWGKIALGFNYSLANDFENFWIANGNSNYPTWIDDANDEDILYLNSNGQYFENLTDGKNSKYTFTFASEYNENLYLGASISSYDIEHYQQILLEEYNNDGNGNNLDASLIQELTQGDAQDLAKIIKGI